MASIEDYKRQQDALNLYSQQLPAQKRMAAPVTAKPVAAPARQQPITMPAGSAGWEAELTRMNNPGTDVREPGQGAFWKDVKSALMYNSDVAAEQARKQAPAVKPPAAQAMANYSNEGRNFTNPIVAAATTQAKPQAMPQPEAPAAEAPQARQVAPGIYRSGNSYGDSAAAADAFNKPNVISPQNMAAADALASRYAGPMGGGYSTPQNSGQKWTARDNAIMAANIRDGVDPYRGTSQQQGPSAYIPKDTGGYGLLDKGYRERRAAMMDAQQFKPGARTALAALLKEQSAQGDREAQAEQNAADRGFRQGENALDRGLRSQELMARMDDSAATRQLRAQELQDNMATNAVKRDAAGVEVTSAKQMADLRSQYLNAKTDAERNDAARKLQALSGKEQANKFTVVPGGQEIQMVNGMPTPITRPAMVFDNQTGQFVNQSGGGQQAQGASPAANPSTRPVGTVSTVNGQSAVWDGTKWVRQ